MKRGIKKFISFVLRRFGFSVLKVPAEYEKNTKEGILNFFDMRKDIIRHSLKFNSVPEFELQYPLVKSQTMVPFENLASLYDQVKYLESNSIEGDFVECGVWKGGAVAVMAIANLKYGARRRDIHLFDAFDDICEPNAEVDGERAMKDVMQYTGKDASAMTGQLKPVKGIYTAFGGHGSIEECKHLLFEKVKYDPQRTHFYKGWFQETFPLYAERIGKIAMLRLDSDWYESTKICLEYFFDKVVPGGFVVIDDYGTYDGCKKAVDEFLLSKNIKKYLINASSTNGECYYFIK